VKRGGSATDRFREQLLAIMDRKHHEAWPFFTGATVTKAHLKIHYQQEYYVYVRDFPVFLARIHGQNPPAAVRKMLAENIYEEDTGGLALGVSHPELFLKMMEGLRLRRADFEQIRPLTASRLYRAWLDRVSASRDWVVGAAAMAIFVEGSVKDRREILEPSKPKTPEEIEAYVQAHPLVRHQRVSPGAMDLIRAHQKVESGHRQDAYDMVVNYATSRAQQQAVLACVQTSLDLWLKYRDGVARACGVKTS